MWTDRRSYVPLRMTLFRAWVIVTALAVGVLAFATYHVAWGYDFVPGTQYHSVLSGATGTVVSAVSSSSVNTVLRISCQGTTGSCTWTCGPTTWNLGREDAAYAYGPLACTGYSLKVSSVVGTGVVAGTEWIAGAYTAPSAGTVNVDVATDFSPLYPSIAFALFLTALFGVIRSLRKS